MKLSLRKAFSILDGDVVSLVGAGGKTTLMLAIAREMASSGSRVISTTTTKILEPEPSQTLLLIVEKNIDKLIYSVRQNIGRLCHITIASERVSNGKLKGISTDTVEKLAEMNISDVILIEADGAAGRSLKAPNPTEPVIPPDTSLVIPIIGIDALGCPLTEEYVFRHKIASELLNLPENGIITAGDIATLLTHREGITKGSPEGARIIPFLNKADAVGGAAKGKLIAKAILGRKHPRIDRVIVGQAQLPEPVLEIIRR